MLKVSARRERRVGKEEEAPVSVEEDNKVLVRRLFEEVYNRGNLDAADELLSPDYVDHAVPPGKYAGREGLKRSVAKQRASSSDLHSDGLVEAHDPEGEMFGFPRLRAFIAEHAEEGALGEFLLEELYSFVGEGWEQEDDITLLALRHSASPS
jgi:hypothetical protein